MSNALSKMSLRAQARGAIERITSVENDVIQAVKAMDQLAKTIEQRLAATEEVLSAVVQHMGADAVQEAVVAERMRKAQETSDREKAALEQAVVDGYCLPADFITEKSIIVGCETDKDGKVMGVGRHQLAFSTVAPQFQEQLLGKGAGTKIKTPIEGEFEVLSVFAVDEDKARAFFEARAKQEVAAANEAAVAQQEPAADNTAVVP